MWGSYFKTSGCTHPREESFVKWQRGVGAWPSYFSDMYDDQNTVTKANAVFLRHLDLSNTDKLRYSVSSAIVCFSGNQVFEVVGFLVTPAYGTFKGFYLVSLDFSRFFSKCRVTLDIPQATLVGMPESLILILKLLELIK